MFNKLITKKCVWFVLCHVKIIIKPFHVIFLVSNGSQKIIYNDRTQRTGKVPPKRENKLQIKDKYRQMGKNIIS